MCNGTKESNLNIRKKKNLKPTPPRPVSILSMTSGSFKDPQQSTSFTQVFMSNGYEDKSSYPNPSNWINALSSRKEKEKFVVDLSKVLLDHLPLKVAVESINVFEKMLEPSSAKFQNSEVEEYSSKFQETESSFSSRLHNSEILSYGSKFRDPDSNHNPRTRSSEPRDYNSSSTTPVSQLKSEVMGDYPEDSNNDQNSAILSTSR